MEITVPFSKYFGEVQNEGPYPPENIRFAITGDKKWEDMERLQELLFLGGLLYYAKAVEEKPEQFFQEKELEVLFLEAHIYDEQTIYVGDLKIPFPEEATRVHLSVQKNEVETRSHYSNWKENIDRFTQVSFPLVTHNGIKKPFFNLIAKDLLQLREEALSDEQIFLEAEISNSERMIVNFQEPLIQEESWFDEDEGMFKHEYLLKLISGSVFAFRNLFSMANEGVRCSWDKEFVSLPPDRQILGGLVEVEEEGGEDCQDIIHIDWDGEPGLHYRFQVKKLWEQKEVTANILVSKNFERSRTRIKGRLKNIVAHFADLKNYKISWSIPTEEDMKSNDPTPITFTFHAPDMDDLPAFATNFQAFSHIHLPYLLSSSIEKGGGA